MCFVDEQLQPHPFPAFLLPLRQRLWWDFESAAKKDGWRFQLCSISPNRTKSLGSELASTMTPPNASTLPLSLLLSINVCSFCGSSQVPTKRRKPAGERDT